MFFIGIFGVESKEKILGEITDFNCKNCGYQRGKVLKRFSFFHFFFIPLFRWNESYFVVCQQCNSIFAISKEKGHAFEKGDGNITYWDLKPVSLHALPKYCASCGKSIESNYEYCPYCGKHINKDEE